MSFAIRKAAENDIPAIVELNSFFADHHHDLDSYWRTGDEVTPAFDEYVKADMRKSNAMWIIAESEGKIVGFFLAEINVPKPYVSKNKIGYIAKAFVLPEYRGKGISKAAVQKFIEWFKENKIETVELSVDSRNKEGVQAWEGLGFKEYMKKMKLDL